ncbi:MAG TPA: hypothetical protein VFI92_09560 [Steroidobacteraceae bacterium]|nr:hypothetical protein [Steroidobacteraceae bacterium]
MHQWQSPTLGSSIPDIGGAAAQQKVGHETPHRLIAFRGPRGKNRAMNANPAPGAPGPSRSGTHPLRRACALLASALLVTSVQGVAQEPIAAVWQPRKLSFSYSSSTAIFSCSALAGRVASILRAVGARDDIQVKASGCSESIPPSSTRVNDRVSMSTWDPMSDRTAARSTDGRQHVNVYVRLMLPTEVTPQVRAELEKDKSRRELVSRVTGDPVARFNDPVMFSAQWQPVTLSRKTIGITPEECELLDQMSPGVFRELGLRVVRSSFVCSADSLLPPEMVVEALLAAPYPSSTAPEAPSAGKEGPAPSAPAGSDDEDVGQDDRSSDVQ